jgi:MFS family permease
MFRSALAHRDLRLLLAGMLVSLAGSWAYNVALLAVVYDRTGSLAWVGAATLGRFLPSILCSPYAGVLAERLERVRLMVACDLTAAASQAVLAVVVLVSGPVALIIALGGLTAVLTTPYEPAVAAVVPQVVEEDDLAAANALRGVIENGVQVAGPALGALVLIVLPAWSVFALDGASFLASAALVARMRIRSRPVDVTEGGAAGPLRQMRVGLREIGRCSSWARPTSASESAPTASGCC